jgi:hypothetical protein
MKILRWAATALTLLMTLMNLGVVFDSQQSDGVRVLGAALTAVGVAAVALAFGRRWAPAIVAAAAANLVAALVGLVAGWEGAAIGLALNAVIGVLAMVAAAPARRGSVTTA